MVKAPEKFLDEYLSREKGLGSGKKSSGTPVRKVSDEEAARLKKNLQTLWDIYSTPEIKEILSREHEIRFFVAKYPIAFDRGSLYTRCG